MVTELKKAIIYIVIDFAALSLVIGFCLIEVSELSTRLLKKDK